MLANNDTKPRGSCLAYVLYCDTQSGTANSEPVKRPVQDAITVHTMWAQFGTRCESSLMRTFLCTNVTVQARKRDQ